MYGIIETFFQTGIWIPRIVSRW